MIKIKNPRFVRFVNKGTFELFLTEKDMELLAGDIQAWLMREKGIMCDIEVGQVV